MQRSCSDLGVDPLSLPHKFYIQFCHVTTLTGTWKGKPPNLKSLKPVLHRILDPLRLQNTLSLGMPLRAKRSTPHVHILSDIVLCQYASYLIMSAVQGLE